MFQNPLVNQRITVGNETLQGEDLEAAVDAWRTKLTSALSQQDTGQYPALLLDNSLDSHLIVLALARGSLNCAIIDANLPLARIKELLQQLETQHAFSPGTADAIRSLREEGISISVISDMSGDVPSPVSSQASGELVIFTSGTTGRPKGVVIPWSTIETWITWRSQLAREFADPYVSIGFSPITFGHGILLTTEIYAGGSVVLLEPRNFTPGQLIGEIAQHTPTVLNTPPQLLRTLSIAAPQYVGPELHSVRLLSLAGGFVESNWVRDLGTLLAKDCVVHHNLSASESARYFQWTAPIDKIPPSGRLPIGLPRSAGDVRLEPVDGVDNALTVFVSGAIARGYLYQPDSATRWTTDTDGRIWWESGDIVSWDEQHSAYFHEGRADDLVKVGGYLVALGDVQRAIAQSPQVVDAAVTSHTVNQRVHLVAHVSGAAQGELNLSRLRTHLATLLPKWSQPTVYLLWDSIPMTSRGKVDSSALRQRATEHFEATSDPSGGQLARNS